MKEIYDAKNDPQFSKGYIDIDEIKIRKLENGSEIKYRYIHGGFEGTSVRFSFCYPEKEMYEERFYQYLSPFPAPEEELASLPVMGSDDKIAFALTHGAYYVETNMGSTGMYSNSEDNTMTYRSSAAAAEFSRIVAQDIYGYKHRPYGYVYGGSGGGYRTIACIENTNSFDGAVPYVIGSPYAIPNCQTTRAHAERLLRNKILQIIDAMDAGGSGNPYEGLNEEEVKALKEVTLFGYPLKSWFASAYLNDGALPVLAPGVKAIDPKYFEDFWKVSGYLGADSNSSAVRERIYVNTKITNIYYFDNKKRNLVEKIDTRNGVNDAWKKMISNIDDGETENWIELEETPKQENLYLKGTKIIFTSGKAKGKQIQVERIEKNRIYFTEGFAMDNIQEVFEMINVGDNVLLDNSDYIAIQTYHRHQVPSLDYKAWDQFRDEDGKPLYPQQKNLIGPIFCGNGPGCKQNGFIQGKIIIVASLMDEQAYPWQADWYKRKVESVHDGKADGICRLWYFDNVLHGDKTESMNELYATTYVGGLNQALIDLANWVEKNDEPIPSSNYSINIGQVEIGDTAKERGGLQPVVNLMANGSKCAYVKKGEEVTFVAEAEVPNRAGTLTFVEWSFEGEKDFPVKGEFELSNGGQNGISKMVHKFENSGTYFGVVRVKAERNGNKNALFTQIRNIDRVRVVVE
jgi:hypothetical protein